MKQICFQGREPSGAQDTPPELWSVKETFSPHSPPLDASGASQPLRPPQSLLAMYAVSKAIEGLDFTVFFSVLKKIRRNFVDFTTIFLQPYLLTA